MVKLYDGGVYLVNSAEIVPESESEKVKALTDPERQIITDGCLINYYRNNK